MIDAKAILAVEDVQKSAKWYKQLFNCIATHGGDEFEMLASEKGEHFLYLHKKDAHAHANFQGDKENFGKGFILYFTVNSVDEAWTQAQELGATIEEDLQLSQNSHRMEFSVRDPDGYFLTISEK